MRRILATLILCLLACAATSANAQFFPGGCPNNNWVNGYCVCPDGSYANMIGDQIVCNSHGNSGSSGNVCSNGGTCRLDQTCCGNYCCNPGSYCSKYGCIANGSIECGGWSCNPGQQCSHMFNRCLPQGMVDCGNYYCQPGQRCTGDTRYRYCLGEGEVDCGTYHCPQGTRCASGHQACLTSNDTDCGGWHCGEGKKCASGRSCIPVNNTDCGSNSTISCRSGTKCSRDGKRCIPENGIDCGSYSCNAGYKCGSRNTCLPHDSVDCGNGGSCSAGKKCSGDGKHCFDRNAVDCGGGRSCPAGRLCINGGAECLTRAEIADREAAERKRKADEAAERQRIAEAQAAVERRQREEQEKQRLAQKDALARQKAEEELRKRVEAQRQADLQKAAKLQQQQLKSVAQPAGSSCALRKLQAWADGRDGNAIVCSDAIPQTAPKTTSPPVTTTQQDMQWQRQLEYLRQNQVRLQPEQRLIELPTSPAPAKSQEVAKNTCTSTFMCGTPPNRYVCPCTVEAREETINKDFGREQGVGDGVAGGVGLTFADGKFSDASIGLGKTVTYSLREVQGQIYGVNTRLSALQIQGVVTAGVGTKGACIEVNGKVALAHAEARQGATTLSADAGSVEARGTAFISPSGAGGEVGIAAYAAKARVDESFKVAGLRISGYAQSGIGLEAKAGFNVGAQDDKITLGGGPFEVGLEAVRN